MRKLVDDHETERRIHDRADILLAIERGRSETIGQPALLQNRRESE